MNNLSNQKIGMCTLGNEMQGFCVFFFTLVSNFHEFSPKPKHLYMLKERLDSLRNIFNEHN